MGRRSFVRQRILEAAFDLFAKKGFEAVSSREIADAAEVGPSSMYRHFTSMEELGRAVYATAIPPIDTLVNDLHDRSRGARGLIEALCAGLYQAYDQRPRALALLIFPPHDFDPEEMSATNPQALRSQLLTIVSDPDLSAIIWGAIVGPLQDRFLRRRAGLMAPLAEQHIQLIIRLLPLSPQA